MTNSAMDKIEELIDESGRCLKCGNIHDCNFYDEVMRLATELNQQVELLLKQIEDIAEKPELEDK